MPKRPCATVLFVEIGVKTLCAAVNLLKLLLTVYNLSRTPCANFLLLEVGVNTLYATVVFL